MHSSPTLQNSNKLNSPLLNRARKKRKPEQFVLDCTNPFQSRMQEYIPQQDPYNQPYLSVLLTKVQQDDSPSLFDFKVTKKKVQTISSSDFKNFLSSKINALKKIDQNAKRVQDSTRKNQMSGKKCRLQSKQAKWVQNKYRCFLESKSKVSKK